MNDNNNNRAWQMLSGLEVIHLRAGCHRHLTPRNFLFNDDRRQAIKIADIGVFGCPFTSPIPLTDAAIRYVPHHHTCQCC
jgi:serine/threonine protein kinase